MSISSRIIFGRPEKDSDTPDIRCGKQIFVTAERSLLASLLWDLKNGEDLSLRKMSQRSGGMVSVSTLHDIMSGKTKELTDTTIAGVSRILGVSEAHVLATLRGRALSEAEVQSETKERIWEMFTDIPAQCQKDVMDLLTVLQANHSLSRRRERLSEHRETVTRRREAALSPHLPGEEFVPGEIVFDTADDLAVMSGIDDDEHNNTEKERKSA